MRNQIQQCIKWNKALISKGLVVQTFGNVSVKVDDDYFVIKPSGAALDSLDEASYPVIQISSGKVISGTLKPSSDTPTHLCLYRAYSEIGGIAHFHSKYATSWAQAGRAIPILGTTHADYWRSDIPITREMRPEEISQNFEYNTGKVIVETLNGLGVRAGDCAGLNVLNHGPFTWGKSAEKAVLNAEIMEFIAEMALATLALNPSAQISDELVKKHYERKHGVDAYYGQNKL